MLNYLGALLMVNKIFFSFQDNTSRQLGIQVLSPRNPESNVITATTESSWVYNAEEEAPPPSYFDAIHSPSYSKPKQVGYI